ncbi:T9SS type A sorting domain-containing protein [Flammeovirga sp. SubArs3]|uniref:T9SS type A sorting domain-containing protein n=1 Tax=Flammeovirga sp. SubArs3 TaxID=2995316 RepID=UPI00248B486B|nr:T9SS type A sorting domain-containing protein [Flammeovirga sp. SubArs3]
MRTIQLTLLISLCLYFFSNTVYSQTLPTSGLVFHLDSDQGLTVGGDGKVTWVEQIQGASFVSDGTTDLEVVDVKYNGLNTDFSAVKFSDNGYLKLQSNVTYSDVKRVFIVYKSSFKPLYNNSTDLMMLFGDRYTQVALETRSRVVNAGLGREYVPYTFSLDGNSEWNPTAKHAINFNSLSDEYHDNTDPRDDAWTYNEWEIVEVEYITSRDLVQGTNGDGNWSNIELGRLVHNTSMFFQGEIAEVIVYNDSFSDQDDLKDYIKDKYKIQQRQWFTTASSTSWDGTNAWSLDSTTLDVGNAPYSYPVTGDKAFVMKGHTINMIENHVNLNELMIDENAVVNAREYINHNFHAFKGTGTYRTYANELPNCDLLGNETFYLEGGGIFHFSADDLNNNSDVALSDDRYSTFNFNSLIVNIGAYEFDFGSDVHVYDTLKVYNSTIKLTHDMEVDSNFVLYSSSKIIDDGNDRELMIRGHFNISDGCEVDIENTLVRFEGEGSKDNDNTYYQRFQIGGPTKVKKVRIERPDVKDQVQIISTNEAYQLEFNSATPNNGLDGDGNYDPSLFHIELVKGRLRFADNVQHELITSTVGGENPIRKITDGMNIWISGSNQISVNTIDTASLIIENGGFMTAVSTSEIALNKTNLTIQGTLQLGISNGGSTNGLLTVDGNVTFDGSNSKFNYRSGIMTLTGNFFKGTEVVKRSGASDPVIKFSGTRPSYISADFDTDFRIGQLIIDKSVGGSQPGLVVRDYEVFTNNVIFNNGLLNANGLLTWDTTTDEKQSSAISKDSYIIGKASFIVDQGGSAYFPIGGTSGFYLAGVGPAPLTDFNRTVSAGANLITWQAMYVDEAIGGDIPSDQYSKKYEDGMWRINPNKATSTEITFFLENADITEVDGEDKSDNLRVLTRDNSSLSNNMTWEHRSGIGNPPKEFKRDDTPGNEDKLLAIKTEAFSFNAGEIPSGASGLRVMSGLSNYEFTPGLSINEDLPVELIDFTAEVNTGIVELKWSTAQELNNDGFYIEKSVDKKHWHEVDFIKGQGTTSVRNDYSTEDTAPFQGTSYYRLVQLDFDGKMEVFSPQEITIGEVATGEFLMYPNPNKGILTFKFFNTSSDAIQLNIYTQLGEIVNRILVDSSYNNSLRWDTSQLASGVYIVEYINKKERQLKKLIVN